MCFLFKVCEGKRSSHVYSTMAKLSCVASGGGPTPDQKHQMMLALVTRPLACTVVALGAKSIPRLSSAAQLVDAARLRHMQGPT